MNEEQRYHGVEADVKHWPDVAALARNPALGFGAALFAAGMFVQNEEARMRHEEARAALIATIERRIQAVQALTLLEHIEAAQEAVRIAQEQMQQAWMLAEERKGLSYSEICLSRSELQCTDTTLRYLKQHIEKREKQP